MRVYSFLLNPSKIKNQVFVIKCLANWLMSCCKKSSDWISDWIAWAISFYSKALRCTFFGERKKSCSSKFVQLLLLNRVKARWSKNLKGFHYINSFSSIFFGPNSKTCICKAVYLEALLYVQLQMSVLIQSSS